MTTLRQVSFTGGELAPSLYAHVDQSKYQSGLRTLRGYLIMRHGGVTNRPGTRFVGEVKDSTKTVRLIPFEFNDDQTYMLEFGDEYMRVIHEGAYVTDLDLTITNINSSASATVTYTGTDPTSGDEVAISGVSGMTEVNGRNFKIANVNGTANTFELRYMDGSVVDSTGFGAYTSGGTASRIYTETSPFTEESLSGIQYVQSADLIFLVSPIVGEFTEDISGNVSGNGVVRLSRNDHDDWSFGFVSFALFPLFSVWSYANFGNSGAAGDDGDAWGLTRYGASRYTGGSSGPHSRESIISSAEGETTSNDTASSGSPITLDWFAGSGLFNIYKKANGVYGFIGQGIGGISPEFVDDGIEPDTSIRPPTGDHLLSGVGNDLGYAAISIIQQRLWLANTGLEPEAVMVSQVGAFDYFAKLTPITDSDAFKFSLSSKKVNAIRHMVDVGKPVIFTSNGIHVLLGNEAGIITPTSINPKQQSYTGSSTVAPIVIGNSAIFVQSQGSIVRDLGFDLQVDGYQGNDLTIFSAHLLKHNTIVEWAYQEVPHSVVWAVRDDGVLLGLTYVREHQIAGWHRHDFDGVVENVATIAEGNENSLYLVVQREIDGRTVRYVEQMATRNFEDVKDAKFMDCNLSYDGRNTDDSHTMTLSGSGWTHDDTLTLTSSASFFTSDDIGNEIQLTGSDGTLIRFEITGFTGVTIVTGKPHKDVPAAMQSAAISDWAKAVDEVGGLWHIEGEAVSVLGDGFVVASPNNASYDVITVTNGTINLSRPYAVIHVGLPITYDIETLDVDNPSGETIADKKMIIGNLTVKVEDTRGLFAGSRPPSDDDVDPLEGLYELKIRDEEGYDDPVAMHTGSAEIILQSTWNSNGRVFIRQVDPLPASILGIYPDGYYPFRG